GDPLRLGRGARGSRPGPPLGPRRSRLRRGRRPRRLRRRGRRTLTPGCRRISRPGTLAPSIFPRSPRFTVHDFATVLIDQAHSSAWSTDPARAATMNPANPADASLALAVAAL